MVDSIKQIHFARGRTGRDRCLCIFHHPQYSEPDRSPCLSPPGIACGGMSKIQGDLLDVRWAADFIQ